MKVIVTDIPGYGSRIQFVNDGKPITDADRKLMAELKAQASATGGTVKTAQPDGTGGFKMVDETVKPA